ncbi:MAG: hypothetical protein K8S15_02240 [Candidatus Aegiribacteria sp.]|nr:hypothetical protein [Candidatus Aegiribacteria sp.]
MRNRWYRYFWTELGRRITGTETEFPLYLPDEMADVLHAEVPEHAEFSFLLGSKMFPRKARNIYGYTWEILRGRGFSRSLRLMPWPGVYMLVPFYRNDIGVIPQSFSRRIPPEKRALSLVGKSAAARSLGIDLWIVPANWNDDVLAIFRSGGVKACSHDNLAGICEEEFR